MAGINATLGRQGQARVKTGTGSGGLSGAAGAGVTLSSAIITQTTTASLAEIGNVNEDAKANNAVLVFNNETNRYEVKPLPSAAIDENTIEAVLAQGNVNMDGGTF
jgi:hypothetical protein